MTATKTPSCQRAARRQPRRSPRLRLRSLPQRPHRLDATPDELTTRSTKGSADGRPPAFDTAIYRKRNIVERCFNQTVARPGHPLRQTGIALSNQPLLIAAIIWLMIGRSSP